MISELNDKEILEFLMTSDFEQEYKPEEFRYLLIKWRYFYRLLHSKLELHKSMSEGEIKSLKEDLKNNKELIFKIQSKSIENDDILKSLKNRKLTLRERLNGKIIIKNEN